MTSTQPVTFTRRPAPHGAQPSDGRYPTHRQPPYEATDSRPTTETAQEKTGSTANTASTVNAANAGNAAIEAQLRKADAALALLRAVNRRNGFR